ncbi:hypothetical protein [Candidatus Electrothrix sp.]|uniref:hypothetical protein n=1 Tax=Candidatus Electrothrix sp. TaxID=2170559 RepID=UPI0040570344
MNLILFVHQEASQQGEALQKKMAKYFGENIIQLVHTFNALRHMLKQPEGGDQEVYVLLAESPRRLQELFCLINLLDGRRIVLILPDDDKTTVSMAHRFYPRFFTYINNNYDDLCAVLYKMINKKHP